MSSWHDGLSPEMLAMLGVGRMQGSSSPPPPLTASLSDDEMTQKLEGSSGGGEGGSTDGPLTSRLLGDFHKPTVFGPSTYSSGSMGAGPRGGDLPDLMKASVRSEPQPESSKEPPLPPPHGPPGSIPCADLGVPAGGTGLGGVGLRVHTALGGGAPISHSSSSAPRKLRLELLHEDDVSAWGWRRLVCRDLGLRDPGIYVLAGRGCAS